uniref:F-box domain-containing protein n=1 Tax=Scylla olivacea TaxID=85551 RepID=A0A0P4W460_SCYOL
MVLTRLSHFGEVCPLRDHSYSDPAAPPSYAYLPPVKRISVSGSSKSSATSASHSASNQPASPASSSASGSSSPPSSPPSYFASQSPSSVSSSSTVSSFLSYFSSTSSSSLSSSAVVTTPAASPTPSGTACASQSVHTVQVTKIELLDLPNEIFEKVFSYLSYKKICEIRLTCKRFEQIGSNILNSTFQRLQNQMLLRFQSIKGQMPRRESARRKHPLARESDIIETLHMRLTLLQMSFGKHIERKHCCFFAGDILDEVYRILSYIKKTPNLGRAYKVTDELFDLSTMAMEYFREHIEPRLPEITCFGSDFLDITSRFSEGCGIRSSSGSGRVSEPEDELPERDPLPPSNMVLRKRIKRIRQGMRRYNTQLVALRRELKGCKSKLADQSKQNIEFATRFDEYDKKFEESARKFSTVLQELNKCKTELQYWRSKSPAQVCYSCGQSMGDGPSQQLQAGNMVQGGEESMVYIPLSTAAVPESAEKREHAGLHSHNEVQDRWHAVRDSVRNLDYVFDPYCPSSIKPVSESLRKPQATSLKLQAPYQSISTSQACVSSQGMPEFQGKTASRASSHPPHNSNPAHVSQPETASLPPTTTSQTMASSHSDQASTPNLSASLVPTKSLPLNTSQSQSAFHSCAASHDMQHLWDANQECAEDLSVSCQYKNDNAEESENSTQKRRSSDEESDNCDFVDDTVGHRVKQRKRIKLDIQ